MITIWVISLLPHCCLYLRKAGCLRESIVTKAATVEDPTQLCTWWERNARFSIPYVGLVTWALERSYSVGTWSWTVAIVNTAGTFVNICWYRLAGWYKYHIQCRTGIISAALEMLQATYMSRFYAFFFFLVCMVVG